MKSIIEINLYCYLYLVNMLYSQKRYLILNFLFYLSLIEHSRHINEQFDVCHIKYICNIYVL